MTAGDNPAAALVPRPQSFQITGRPLPPEGYRLRVDAEGRAEITAADAAGHFYAEQTLRQLGDVKGPIAIEDWPQYRWRGVMLDEGRHFFGKAAVKDILDRMARYKLNVFHWHLTEDQGWRLDIPGCPEIARWGAARPSSWLPETEDRPDGKPYGPFFYTAADVREILDHARARHIRVVPEIELPGHFRAMLAAHPEFACAGAEPGPRAPWTETGITPLVMCPGNDAAIAFMERVFDAVTAMFPGEVIHLGGDECPWDNWKRCPRCQARIRALGLRDEAALQAWLVRHFVNYLQTKGRRAMGWDEIILGGGLDRGAIVQSWRPVGWFGAGEVKVPPALLAAQAGNDVVASPCDRVYFSLPPTRAEPVVYRKPLAEYRDGELLDLRKVYAFDPRQDVPEGLKARIIGSESCNWTEGTRDYANLTAKMWPRTAALAEVLWTGDSRGPYADFARRMGL